MVHILRIYKVCTMGLAEELCYGMMLILEVDRDFELTFETPKSESVKLFELGERAYDHLLILPTKSKGRWTSHSHGQDPV